MNTALFTGYNDAYAPLAELTCPLMVAYASRHGYDFDCYRDWSLPTYYPPLEIPNRVYWTGVAGALTLLRNRNYERVIYLDVDQMITNPDREIDISQDGYRIAPFGFHVSKDWGADATEHWHFSMCGFIAHRECIPLFEECLAMEPGWRDKPFPEQGPMREIVRKRIEQMDFYPLKENQWNATMNLHPRRFLNAVPKEVDPTVQEPWQPGDFAAHLTNLPIDKRVELFHEIKKQAGI